MQCAASRQEEALSAAGGHQPEPRTGGGGSRRPPAERSACLCQVGALCPCRGDAQRDQKPRALALHLPSNELSRLLPAGPTIFEYST